MQISSTFNPSHFKNLQFPSSRPVIYLPNVLDSTSSSKYGFLRRVETCSNILTNHSHETMRITYMGSLANHNPPGLSPGDEVLIVVKTKRSFFEKSTGLSTPLTSAPVLKKRTRDALRQFLRGHLGTRPALSTVGLNKPCLGVHAAVKIPEEMLGIINRPSLQTSCGGTAQYYTLDIDFRQPSSCSSHHNSSYFKPIFARIEIGK